MGMFSFSSKKKHKYGQGGSAQYQQKGFLSGLGFGSFSSSDRRRRAYAGQPGYGQQPAQPFQQPVVAQPVAAAQAPVAGGANCSQCGAANPAGAKFCLQCGTPIQQASGFCGSCGSQVPPNAKFCPSCGTPR